ncbi:hypothetical protein [Roseivirga misakiensis]|uniref:Uncharacterized protein n=1 Tax=Roseivirga misakiensis TaxID=1563681 RepID=A0A1E5T5F1_9BACT|nr:hypothetical protein [Roseivirga misakiensis]OEK06614.1 hypothetical protein BFP71_02800 [Roseivirga misakiensis]
MDKDKIVLTLTSKKFQTIGILISIGFVVLNIFQLSILDEVIDKNYDLKRGILVSTMIFFGLLACIGIATMIYNKKNNNIR